MPYSATSSNLPKNVKAMPKNKRKQWSDVFNSAISSGKDESTAFAMANGVAKKAKDDKSSSKELTASDKSLEGSYEDLAEDILSQLNDLCESSDDWDCCLGIVGTFPEYAIMGCYHWQGDSSYWKIPYTMDGVEPKVSDHEQWEQLEIDYVPVGAGQYSDEDDDFDLEADDKGIAFGVKAELDSGKGSKKRSKLKKSDFAYVDDEGKGHFPIYDASHTRNALARLSQSPYGDKARPKVLAAARKFGIKVSSASSSSKAVTTQASADGFMNKVRTALSFLRGTSHDASTRAFYVTKDAESGRMRYFTVMTNNFKDREKELFTGASHKSFIKWCDDQGSYPELWVWHAKGTEFGVGDWIDFVEAPGGGGVVVTSGLITPGMEERAEYLSSQDVAMSHGFIGHRTKEGHWTEYVSWEQSVLPTHAVANYGTAFNLLGLKEESMPFTAEKRAFLSKLPGATEATVKEWESQTEGMVKNLKSLGIEYKELGVEEPAEENAATKEAIAPGIIEHISAMTAANKALSDKLDQQATELATVKDQLKDVVALASKAAVNTDAEVQAKLKELLTPRSMGAITSQAHVASAAKENVVEGAAKETNEAWFMQGMQKAAESLGLGGNGVPSGPAAPPSPADVAARA